MKKRSSDIASADLRDLPVGLPEYRKLGAGNERFAAVVVITEIDRGQASGALYNLFGGVIAPFRDLGDLVMKLDIMVDMAHIPREAGGGLDTQDSFFASLQWPAKPKSPFQMVVSILYRQHFSLQGQLRVKGLPSPINFRSALELIYIIHSAVCDCGDFHAAD